MCTVLINHVVSDPNISNSCCSYNQSTPSRYDEKSVIMLKCLLCVVDDVPTGNGLLYVLNFEHMFLYVLRSELFTFYFLLTAKES